MGALVLLGCSTVYNSSFKGRLLVLYGYKRFSTSESRLLKANPFNQEKVEFNFAHGEWTKLLATRDGKRLAKLDARALAVSVTPFTAPWREVYRTASDQEHIMDAIWSSDGSALAVFTFKSFGSASEDPFVPSPGEMSFYLVNRNGTSSRLVKRFSDADSFIANSLIGFNTNQAEVYWVFQGSDGGVGDLTVMSALDGSIKAIKRDVGPAWLYLLLNSDQSRAYYISEDARNIFEYSLLNDTKRILFSFHGSQSDPGYTAESRIARLVLSPVDDALVFTVRTKGKDITYRMLLPQGKLETLVEDFSFHNAHPSHWSPDGKYLWFETWGFDQGEYYVMDLDTKKMHLFFRGKRGDYHQTGEGVRVDEALQFIAWLVI